MKKIIYALLSLILLMNLAKSDNFKPHVITFPANEIEKTEYNASIYEIEPFDLSLELPNDWTLRERESPDWNDAGIALIGGWSILDIYNADGNCVGAVGYNTYELYEGAEDVPAAIYNQIALGNDYNFDVRESYKIINEADSGVTATVDVYYSASINNGTEKINNGIVSYSKDLLVYIAIELASEFVSDDEWENIAKSIKVAIPEKVEE